jgi:hypothetical protein
MATHPIVVVHHGRVDIPLELQDDPQFKDGAQLQLIPVQGTRRVPEQDAKSWENFRKLRGVLAHSDYDPNAELEKEKQRELAQEAGCL